MLLAALKDARQRSFDAGVDPAKPFETMVIPNAIPTPQIYDDLAAKGVTSTVCMPWNLGDPAIAPVGANIDAMATFSEHFIEGR